MILTAEDIDKVQGETGYWVQGTGFRVRRGKFTAEGNEVAGNSQDIDLIDGSIFLDSS
jgi:hypothetical protein